ncbi:hypothetical protein [Nocardia macrotermitis]|uniref:Uncharacterized protein n=1 Tax=Nocardia macrotermitis TaxID=2585198 RepID=A0A7K0DC22_9NOCA|nr:hypothetical protein [Nocardia macrotermitis]MQY23081.1 hypothetical protein [Nocardia macrotermitis]
MSTSIPFDAAQGGERPVTADRITVADSTGAAARAGAWVVLLGIVVTTVGTSWDIQWHDEVGPDTFFTLPHLFLYSGSAISGFASLALVVLMTSAQRAGRAAPRAGGTPIRVFGGTLTAPIGYMVSGAGAALFLLYGLFDLEWHAIYGFDAVLNTPSHVALFLSISTTMIGSVIVFSAHRDELWGRIGLIFAIVLLISYAPIPADGLNNLPLPVDAIVAATVLFAPMLLIMGALVLERAGSALAIGVAMSLVQGLLWWFSPWAAHVYASAVGLPLRDGLLPLPPAFPSIMPMFLIVAAVAVEGMFALARARNLGPQRTLLATGVVTGVILGIGLPLQAVLTDPVAHIAASMFVVIGLLGVPFGLVAGYFGGRFAAMLRTLAPLSTARETL